MEGLKLEVDCIDEELTDFSTEVKEEETLPYSDTSKPQHSIDLLPFTDEKSSSFSPESVKEEILSECNDSLLQDASVTTLYGSDSCGFWTVSVQQEEHTVNSLNDTNQPSIVSTAPTTEPDARTEDDAICRKHRCNVCDTSFVRRGDMQRHKKRKHPEACVSRRYSCPVSWCEITRTSKQALNIHVNFVHDGKRLACVHCGKLFVSKCELDVHCTSEHDDLKFRYVCRICATGYNQESLFKLHIARHEEMPFISTKWDKKFTLGTHLKEHRRECKVAEKPFECNRCGKQFKWLDMSGDTAAEKLGKCASCEKISDAALVTLTVTLDQLDDL